MANSPIFWSDQLAYGITQKFPGRDTYVCASGISPSGIVHAGNFREIITTDFVVKSLENLGEDARFIYSWDDYDRFRKVPENVPDEWDQYIGLPLSEVPDPEGCHDSYADHFESKLEDELHDLEMDIEFIRQSEMFKSGTYAELIRQAMNQRHRIREILNKHRSEPLSEDWYPLRVYCKECGKDFTDIRDYDGKYSVFYYCNECELEYEINFKKHDSVKLPWRVDWPMRWHYEEVSFEPGGKDHSAAGSSRDTGAEIIRDIYNDEPPVYQMYDFITRDGQKISSSSGENALTVTDLKKIYPPGLIRFLFSETKPNKEFSIPFEDEEVFQRYEKFDKIEDAYFNPEKMENEKKRAHWRRVYELAVVDIPVEQPVRIPFKHASFLAQTIPENDWASKAISSLKRTDHIPEDIDREGVEQVMERLEKAKNWAREYAPEDYRYEINEEVPESLRESLNDDQRQAMSLLAEMIEEGNYDNQDDLDGKIFDVKEESGLGTGEFFTVAYKVLLSREQGPRLSRLILSIGGRESADILRQVEE